MLEKYIACQLETYMLMTYTTLCNILISHLKHDAAAHERGSYEEIGSHFDTAAEAFDVLPLILPQGSPESDRLQTAMAFWNGWIRDRYQGWGRYADIGLDDWPRQAHSLAEDLAADRNASDPTIRAHFRIM